MIEFEQLTKKIFDCTHQYAINNLPLNYDVHPSTWKPEAIRQFRIYVHRGFRKAQDLILNEMIDIQETIKNLNIELKSSRSNKDKQKSQNIENDIGKLKYKEAILRSFIDFIAWQLLDGEYHKIRRFYNSTDKNNSRPTLSNSNIESVVNAINYYHELDELNFALISDLTSFIDIGDILLMEGNQVIPLEVKEGKTNEEIFKFITSIAKKETDICPYSLVTNPTEKFFKQADRVVKQMHRAHKLIEFLKYEKGVDPFQDVEVKVNKEAYIIESYFEIVNNLLKELEKKNWAYTTIENDTISIGIYQNEFINMGEILLNSLNENMFGKPFPVVNYMQKLYTPISEPIYYQGFSKEHIFDLFFGRIRMFISINFDNFIALCNANGLRARYMSKKETMNIKKEKKATIFEWKSQGIIINEKMMLGDGMIGRMLFDFVKPSSIIENLKLQIAELGIEIEK